MRPRWIPGERRQLGRVNPQHRGEALKGGAAGAMLAGLVAIDRRRGDADGGGEQADGEAGGRPAGCAQSAAERPNAPP